MTTNLFPEQYSDRVKSIPKIFQSYIIKKLNKIEINNKYHIFADLIKGIWDTEQISPKDIVNIIFDLFGFPQIDLSYFNETEQLKIINNFFVNIVNFNKNKMSKDIFKLFFNMYSLQAEVFALDTIDWVTYFRRQNLANNGAYKDVTIAGVVYPNKQQYIFNSNLYLDSGLKMDNGVIMDSNDTNIKTTFLEIQISLNKFYNVITLNNLVVESLNYTKQDYSGGSGSYVYTWSVWNFQALQIPCQPGTLTVKFLGTFGGVQYNCSFNDIIFKFILNQGFIDGTSYWDGKPYASVLRNNNTSSYLDYTDPNNLIGYNYYDGSLSPSIEATDRALINYSTGAISMSFYTGGTKRIVVHGHPGYHTYATFTLDSTLINISYQLSQNNYLWFQQIDQSIEYQIETIRFVLSKIYYSLYINIPLINNTNYFDPVRLINTIFSSDWIAASVEQTLDTPTGNPEPNAYTQLDGTLQFDSGTIEQNLRTLNKSYVIYFSDGSSEKYDFNSLYFFGIVCQSYNTFKVSYTDGMFVGQIITVYGFSGSQLINNDNFTITNINTSTNIITVISNTLPTTNLVSGTGTGTIEASVINKDFIITNDNINFKIIYNSINNKTLIGITTKNSDETLTGLSITFPLLYLKSGKNAIFDIVITR